MRWFKWLHYHCLHLQSVDYILVNIYIKVIWRTINWITFLVITPAKQLKQVVCTQHAWSKKALSYLYLFYLIFPFFVHHRSTYVNTNSSFSFQGNTQIVDQLELRHWFVAPSHHTVRDVKREQYLLAITMVTSSVSVKQFDTVALEHQVDCASQC